MPLLTQQTTHKTLIDNLNHHLKQVLIFINIRCDGLNGHTCKGFIFYICVGVSFDILRSQIFVIR